MIRTTIVIVLTLGSLCIGNSVNGQAGEMKVTIESDGWRLIGDLRMPRSKQPVAVVLMFNKANGTRRAYDALADHLAVHGIASLRLDLRGHGESLNKGKFGAPFDAPMLALIDESEKDISAAISYIKGRKGIDPGRIGVVGASYSGEEMVVSARANGFAKAYVALSPGSFSEESIKGIDSSGAAWLFVRSADERHLKGLHEDIRKTSKLAQLFEVEGNKHASELLQSNPELVEMIAVWFKRKL